MTLGSGNGRTGPGGFSPMHIAHHALFTAREKIEFLKQIRAEVAMDDNPKFGFSPSEIDLAIEEVKQDAQRGQGPRAELGEH